VLCVDPEISSPINVSDVTATSARVSWSIGQTQVVNVTTVYYTDTDTSARTSIPVTGTTHTVTPLQPGTQYEFFVEIDSYGKTATSQTVTATTGKTHHHLTLHFFVLCVAYLLTSTMGSQSCERLYLSGNMPIIMLFIYLTISSTC